MIRPSLALWLILLAAGTIRAGAAAAQGLPLERDVPEIAWAGCAPFSPGPAEDVRPEEAERLAAEATQAAILGDNDAAFDLLVQAAALDPTSATIAYRLARTLEELGREERALDLYCRYLGLAEEDADTDEVRQRITALSAPADFAVPAEAADAFVEGIGHFDAGRFDAAEAAFTEAAAAAPAWSGAVYNRGLTRLSLGRDSAAARDLRQFLEMSPTAPEFERVLDALGALRGMSAAPFNPGSALATGLLVPGLGHFTTGRPGRGMLVLGLAASAVAAGVLMEEVEVRCLGVPVDGICPPDQVLGQEVTRPYLLPGVGVGLAVGILGAIDAYRGAVRGNARAAELLRVGGGTGRDGPTVGLPYVQPGPDGTRLVLLRLRF